MSNPECNTKRKLVMMHRDQEAFSVYVLQHKEDWSKEIIQEAKDYLITKKLAKLKKISKMRNKILSELEALNNLNDAIKIS